MRSDLQALEITIGELKRLTTFNLKEIAFKGKKQIKEQQNISSLIFSLSVWFSRIIGVILLMLGLAYFIDAMWMIWRGESTGLTVDYNIDDIDYVPILCAVILSLLWSSAGIYILSLVKNSVKILMEKYLKTNFLPFIDEVNKHNQIIFNINILDQLEAVGNPVKLNERQKVIEALKINRENIVRALQTERILKENPQFQPEQFNIDLSGLRALEATEKATEYGRFLDEALQIGVSVQTEMRKLENKRLGL